VSMRLGELVGHSSANNDQPTKGHQTPQLHACTPKRESKPVKDTTKSNHILDSWASGFSAELENDRAAVRRTFRAANDILSTKTNRISRESIDFFFRSFVLDSRFEMMARCGIRLA
jgi:hypothetical protein